MGGCLILIYDVLKDQLSIETGHVMGYSCYMLTITLNQQVGHEIGKCRRAIISVLPYATRHRHYDIEVCVNASATDLLCHDQVGDVFFLSGRIAVGRVLCRLDVKKNVYKE